MEVQQIRRYGYVISHLEVLLPNMLSGEKGLECDGLSQGRGQPLFVMGQQGNTESRIEAELRGEGRPLSTTVTS